MSARLIVAAMFASACTGTPPGNTVDGAVPDTAMGVGSRCVETENQISCPYETMRFPALGASRPLRFQTPLGVPPPDGWPVVFYYQGSFVSAENAFFATRDAAFGQFHLTRTIRSLLDSGYAVIAPDAIVELAWQTNLPPYAFSWPTSSDNAFLTTVFQAVRDGELGPLDASHMYAMGISSGGYMTSRMAVSYPGMFRALVIHSASYATCGATCVIPSVLPVDHPPTLFLHGAVDLIVPVAQMEMYRDRLQSDGHVVATLIDEHAGHEWISDAVPAVAAWFAAHP